MGLSKYVMEAKVYHQTRCFWLVIEPPLWKRSISQWIGIIISSGVENSFPKQLHKAWHRLLCVVLHDVALRCVNILLVSKVLSKNIHNSSWVQSWREIAGKPKTKTPVDCKMPILWLSKKRKKKKHSKFDQKNRVSCWISLKPWPSSTEGTVQFSDHFGRLSWSRPGFKWTDLRKQCQGTRGKMALKQRGSCTCSLHPSLEYLGKQKWSWECQRTHIRLVILDISPLLVSRFDFSMVVLSPAGASPATRYAPSRSDKALAAGGIRFSAVFLGGWWVWLS